MTGSAIDGEVGVGAGVGVGVVFCTCDKETDANKKESAKQATASKRRVTFTRNPPNRNQQINDARGETLEH